MEDEDGDGEDSTPFWVQNTNNFRHADRLRRRVSAIFFSSGLVVFLLLVTAVFFFVFVLPKSISFSTQIFKPNSVKKSWDSLNIVLVTVAVVFGFLSRNKNEYNNKDSYFDEFHNKQMEPQISSDPSTPDKWFKYNYTTVEGQKSNLSNSSQWYEFSDYEAKSEQKNSILTRNSSSYPDLRQSSTTHWSNGDYYQRRYYDDTHVISGRIWNSDLKSGQGQGQLHRRHRSLEGVEYLRAPLQNKISIVESFPSKSKEGANFGPPSPAASVGVSPEIKKNPKISMSGSAGTRSNGSSTRVKEDLEPLDLNIAQKLRPVADSPEFTETLELAYQRLGRKDEISSRKRNKDVETSNSTPLQAAPSPPPPRQKSTYRKRGGATGSSTKDFLNSLYLKKKKKQRKKGVDYLDPLLHEAQAPVSFQLPPPSYPTPPPSSVFQNLFSIKKQKRKRTIVVTLGPHTPPPLSPFMATSEPETTSQTSPSTTHKPPNPIKMNSLDRLEETSNSGGESPLNRIPLPPPPPPPPAFYKGPTWKFVVQGDYVRVNSITSSRSGSPDTDDGESDLTPSAVDAGGAATFLSSPLFCPSPDVNTKAESFITDFRAKLKLEKIHSMKKREVGLSGLGTGPRPSPFSQEI